MNLAWTIIKQINSYFKGNAKHINQYKMQYSFNTSDLQPQVLIQTLETKNNYCDKINVFSERSNNIITYIRLRLDITLPEPFISLRITGWELFITGLPILKEPATTNR